jgi:hypothetical protein
MTFGGPPRALLGVVEPDGCLRFKGTYDDCAWFMFRLGLTTFNSLGRDLHFQNPDWQGTVKRLGGNAWEARAWRPTSTRWWL